MQRNKSPRHSRLRWFPAIMGFAVQQQAKSAPCTEAPPVTWPVANILPPPPPCHPAAVARHRPVHGWRRVSEQPASLPAVLPANLPETVPAPVLTTLVDSPEADAVSLFDTDVLDELCEESPYTGYSDILPASTSTSANELLERMRLQLPPEPQPKAADKPAVATWYDVVKAQHGRTLEVLPDGKRLESFRSGASLLKDSLGRVIEARSAGGDCLYFSYGRLGALESFRRTDATGSTHSTGRYERHGVVVRDAEGRVKAAGESITVDPTGGIYLHGVDGQYFCLDLVRGLFRERRRVSAMHGGPAVITALFAEDGFRMATVVFRDATKYDGACGGTCFRFYGRDGSLVEFACEEDVRRLHPRKVSAPATLPVRADFRKHVQARTAWQAVYEYLARVS